MEGENNTRRRVLGLVGSAGVVAIAGCSGGDGDTGGTAVPSPTEDVEMGDAGVEEPERRDEHEEERPEGVSEEAFEHGPVPEPYRTARSQAGERRDPASLFTKEAVKFQEAADAVEGGLAAEGSNCGNCAEYIPDKNGDGFGACARVEGYVDPEDWCVVWESIEDHEADEGS